MCQAASSSTLGRGALRLRSGSSATHESRVALSHYNCYFIFDIDMGLRLLNGCRDMDSRRQIRYGGWTPGEVMESSRAYFRWTNTYLLMWPNSPEIGGGYLSPYGG